MATVKILRETEDGSGWVFEAEVSLGERPASLHTVHLSWADYNHWSPSGTDRPERVALAVLRFLAEHEGRAPILRKFDAASIRRLFPGADEDISGLIG